MRKQNLHVTNYNYNALQMGSMFKPTVFAQIPLSLISVWADDRREDRSRRPDSRSGASNHSNRLQNQPQVSDERITINQGITTSVLELSSPTPISEEV